MYYLISTSLKMALTFYQFTKMEYHTGQRYSDAVGYIRKRLRFEILRTTVISLRGDRGARKNMVDIDSLDLNLEPQG